MYCSMDLRDLEKPPLAGIIANEMGVHMKVTSGPAIAKPGEMGAILSNLQEGRFIVRGRDPSSEPAGGRSTVSGNGGLCH